MGRHPFARLARSLVPMLIGAILLGLPGMTPAQAATPDPAAAEAVVEHYQGALLDVMQHAKGLGIQGRVQSLDGPVRTAFDFARMAQAASGRVWRDADDDTRAAMVEAFARYSVAVHADRFNGYSGESFVLDGTAPGPGETLMVNTHIKRPKGEDISLSYVVAQTNDAQPKIVDVLMKGSISEVALRRSEWAAIGKRDGLAGLARALQSLTDRLLAKDATAQTATP